MVNSTQIDDLIAGKDRMIGELYSRCRVLEEAYKQITEADLDHFTMGPQSDENIPPEYEDDGLYRTNSEYKIKVELLMPSEDGSGYEIVDEMEHNMSGDEYAYHMFKQVHKLLSNDDEEEEE